MKDRDACAHESESDERTIETIVQCLCWFWLGATNCSQTQNSVFTQIQLIGFHIISNHKKSSQNRWHNINERYLCMHSVGIYIVRATLFTVYFLFDTALEPVGVSVTVLVLEYKRIKFQFQYSDRHFDRSNSCVAWNLRIQTSLWTVNTLVYNNCLWFCIRIVSLLILAWFKLVMLSFECSVRAV